VFFDDRFDMYSNEMNREHDILLNVKPGWREVISRWHPDAILWKRSSPLTDLLEASNDWRVAYHDKDWVVFVPKR
jgi:hypothetical protein